MAITQTLTAPTTAPARTQDKDTFNTNVDNRLAWEATNVTELSAMITQINSTEAAMNSAAAGTAFSIPYTFSSTTADADPGAGTLRLDNATQNTATTIRADLAGSDGATWTTVIDTFDDSTSTIKGQIKLTKAGDATKFLTFNVTALASPSGYKNITVANVGSSAASPFTNGDSLILSFTRNGDKGDTGAAGVPNVTRSPRTSNTILGLADKGILIDFTSGTFSQTLTAAATLGDGWWVPYRNSGTGTITLDPNGAETIDGAATLTVAPGDYGFLMCNGTGFYTFGKESAASGSSLVYLSAVTASAVASADIETGFGALYDDYVIVAHSLVTSALENIKGRIKVGGAYLTTNTYISTATTSSTTATSWSVFPAQGAAAAVSGTGRIELGGCNAALPKIGVARGQLWNGTLVGAIDNSLYQASTSPIEGVRLFVDSGTFSGVFKLFGIKKL